MEQRLPVCDLGGHLEPGLGQDPGQSLPEQHRVVGNHHPHPQSVPPEGTSGNPFRPALTCRVTVLLVALDSGVVAGGVPRLR